MLTGTSKEGDKIYAILKANKKTLFRGFHDFNISKFIITKCIYKNLPENQTIYNMLKIFQEKLLLEYDWNLTNLKAICKKLRNCQYK